MDQGPLSVSALLRIHRENLKLSVGILADHLGMREDAVLAVERGTCPIPPEKFQEWCYFLDTDPLYLSARYLNEYAVRFCKRAKLDCTVKISIGVPDGTNQLPNPS